MRRGLLEVSLTSEGEEEEEGQGGKMITSAEIILYGSEDRCVLYPPLVIRRPLMGRFNSTPGHVGAFPTYAEDGTVTLRPTNEGCLMRRVHYPRMYLYIAETGRP